MMNYTATDGPSHANVNSTSIDLLLSLLFTYFQAAEEGKRAIFFKRIITS